MTNGLIFIFKIRSQNCRPKIVKMRQKNHNARSASGAKLHFEFEKCRQLFIRPNDKSFPSPRCASAQKTLRPFAIVLLREQPLTSAAC